MTTLSQKLKPQELKNFIDYQDGSVVSKEIVSKPTGTVTLFALDEGQGLSEHKAPFDALVYILDGEAEVMVAGSLYHLKTDQMLIMPANSIHSLKAIKKFKMLLIMIRS